MLDETLCDSALINSFIFTFPLGWKHHVIKYQIIGNQQITSSTIISCIPSLSHLTFPPVLSQVLVVIFVIG
jgi:hypothetical protein